MDKIKEKIRKERTEEKSELQGKLDILKKEFDKIKGDQDKEAEHAYNACITRRDHALDHGTCGWCNAEVKAIFFNDQKSVDEYFISALCMDCQVAEFGQ